MSSCGPPALQPDLFTVDFTNARYPVMLSQTVSCAGRPISGKSGVYSERSKDYEAKRWNVTGASAQLASQVGSGDKCVHIERVVFSATGEGGLVGQKLQRELSIDGSVSP